jgi:DNA-binding transcriptional ArsR family regulator
MNAAAAMERPITAGGTVDEAVWRALADPTRRRILDLLRRRARTTGALCEPFELTRFAVMKHLRVLEEAGLVIVERRGRERYNHLNPVPIQEIYRRWIRPFDQLPADRLLKLKTLAEASREDAT